MADEADSKSVDGNIVWVQVPPPALKKQVNKLFTCQTVDKAPSCEGAFLVS